MGQLWFGFSGMDLFAGFFTLTFICFFGFFIYTMIAQARRASKQRRMDDAAPRLTVEARVVTKRTEVDSHRHHNSATHTGYTSYSTNYYATFQFESGDRLELAVNGLDYGMLVEGDHGQLSFQGSRFLGFMRS